MHSEVGLGMFCRAFCSTTAWSCVAWFTCKKVIFPCKKKKRKKIRKYKVTWEGLLVVGKILEGKVGWKQLLRKELQRNKKVEYTKATVQKGLQQILSFGLYARGLLWENRNKYWPTPYLFRCRKTNMLNKHKIYYFRHVIEVIWKGSHKPFKRLSRPKESEVTSMG